ncbi:hypothetical protein NQ314_014437 [Rhamnusium bicolor]|uniref:Cytochrome P450 n=1 Tax=Rhamnusium bicolor TaxID=1586634 RepID=A0AAV8X1G5_9CUCU|nr:hypothetical protein NQ314_014437 [Rhamnusium bicolor]
MAFSTGSFLLDLFGIVTALIAVGFVYFKWSYQYWKRRNLPYLEPSIPFGSHLFNIGGKKWRNLRTKLTPTFTSGKLKSMFPILVDCGILLEKYFEESIGGKEAVDIKDVLEPNSPFREYGKKIFEDSKLVTLKMTFAMSFPNVARALGVTVTPKDVSQFFTKVVEDAVTYREKNNYVRKDFLQLLIDIKNNKEQENGSQAQSFVFFIAGFETSSTTMTFALFELATHPEIQKKVREEINTVLAKHNNQITYDSLSDLKYMGQVIDEKMLKEMDFRDIPPMKVAGDFGENWRFWRQRFQTSLRRYLEETTQRAQSLTLIGEGGMWIFNTFTFAIDETNKIKQLLEKFEAHFSPRKNLRYLRHKFLTCKQVEDESIKQFITELKILTLACELGELRDSLVKDLLICGLKSEPLREKLLQDDPEILDDAVKMCINMEQTRERNREITIINEVNEIETLRLYPPLPMLLRLCVEDYKVPGEDVVIEKGTRVIIPICGIHYDEDYYKNPEVFDPERFSEENKKTLNRYTHLPFGEGPRICIGERFGLMQTKIGLTCILRKFTVKLNERTKVPLKMSRNTFITTAEGGIWLDIKEL